MGWFLDFMQWWTTARVAAASAATGGVVAVVTGTTAVRTFRHSRRATQKTTRPMMVAVVKLTGSGSTGLEVTNVGPSIARNVRVSFDPPLPTHDKTPAGTPSLLPYLRRRYAKSIAAWPPGYTLKNEYLVRTPESGAKPDEDGVQPNTDGVPRETAIVFDYTDDDGYPYTDRIPLDPILIQGETWSTTTRNGAVVHDAAPWKQ